jgi:hypothetical protein
MNAGSAILTTRDAVHSTVCFVTRTPTRRAKLGEWVLRYLPCEIAGTAAEFGGAALAYAATDGSLAAAAIAATICASAGYYATAYLSALRWSYRAGAHRRLPTRLALANMLAVRSVVIEFGPAELIDSIAVRPLAFYVGPMLFGNLAAGWVFGKLVSDAAFYTCAILSYERFKGLLVRRHPLIAEQEAQDGPTPAISAA